MEDTTVTEELRVKSSEPVIVAPCTPSPKAMLQLSSIDNIPGLRNVINNLLFVYNATSDKKISALDPAKIIREALSKVLVYYYPFAGRFRSKENGELELECTDEGALFVEATADNDLSVLGDLDHLRPSFQHLLFWHPPHTHVEALHLLALQVTHFTCGGFVLGVSFHHSICDARGGARFLQGLAEMARGYDKPSVEPIWDRELLKLENPTRLQFYHMELNMESIQLPPTIVEESVLAFLVINYETIKHMKKSIAKECKHFFSAFDVVAALAWRARTKALQIPLAENVKLVFAMNMRRSFNPQLPDGYYGNAIGIACAIDNVHDLLTGSLLRATLIVHKAKVSLKDEDFRSRTTKQSTPNIKQDNMLILSDLRQVGFNEVDFGWGGAVNVCPMQQIDNGLVIQNYFLFIRTPKNKHEGIKLQMCMPPSTMKSFQIEMEVMMKEYTAIHVSKL